MVRIKSDFLRACGRMKPIHGVGQPPMLGISGDMLHYLTEANIPFSRLHDVGGAYGRGVFVDVPNIFRSFDADPESPASYDFAFTDRLLSELDRHGVEPFYRLGVTIENYIAVRRYFTYPPKDNLKWARICEGIIRHYTEGWADGYRYKIRYWEIWNEPENHYETEKNQMWSGTMEEYFSLYVTATRYLKERFPHLLFGGYAASGFYYLKRGDVAPYNAHPYDSQTAAWRVEYFEKFLSTVKKSGAPLDFYSWHSYEDTPAYNALYAKYIRKTLDEWGFDKTESSLNEWNPKCTKRGTYEHAAATAANLVAMQKGPVDTAMFYDARCGASVYSGMFNPETMKPYPAYYPFLYFGQLYALGTETYTACDGEDVWVCAAAAKEEGAMLLVNNSEREETVTVEGESYILSDAHILCKGHENEPWSTPDVLPPYSVMLVRYRRI